MGRVRFLKMTYTCVFRNLFMVHNRYNQLIISIILLICEFKEIFELRKSFLENVI